MPHLTSDLRRCDGQDDGRRSAAQMSVRKTLAMDGERIAAQTSLRKAMATLSQYGHLSSSHLFHRH